MKMSSSSTFWTAGKPVGWVAKLALLLLALILALLAGEVATRFIFGVPLASTENWIVRRTSLLRIHLMNDYDPLLGWVLKPGLFTGPETGGKDLFASGDFGVRMNQHKILPVPKGGILTSGDSFAAGSEVSDAETWPAHLERLAQIPVINAGTGAWGADQIILRVESLLEPLQPRAVVVSFMVDDIQRTKYRIYGGGNKPWFQVVDGKLIHNNFPVPVFAGTGNELGFWRSLFGHSYFLDKLAEKFSWKAWWMNGQVYVEEPVDVVAVSVALMDRLNRTLQARGIPLVFLLQYGGSHVTLWEDEPDWAKKTYLGIESLGIPTVNTWGPLRKLRTEKGQPALDRLYVMHDGGKIHGHMSSQGNLFVAQLLEPVVRQALPERGIPTRK